MKGDNEIKWWGKSICLDAVGHVSLFLDFRSLNHFDHSYKAHRAVTDWAWRNLRQKTGFTTWSESQGKDKPEKWNFLFEHRLKSELSLNFSRSSKKNIVN